MVYSKSPPLFMSYFPYLSPTVLRPPKYEGHSGGVPSELGPGFLTFWR